MNNDYNFSTYDLDDEPDFATALSTCCGTKTSYSGKSHNPKSPETVAEMRFSELYRLGDVLNDVTFLKVREIASFKNDTITNEITRRSVSEHPVLNKYFSLKIDYSHKYVFKVDRVYNLWDNYDHHWLISEDSDDPYSVKKNYVTDYDIKFLLEISGYFVNDGKMVMYCTSPKHDYQFGTTSLFGASEKRIIYIPYKLTNLLSCEEWWEDKDAKPEISEITEDDFNNIKRTYKFITGI